MDNNLEIRHIVGKNLSNLRKNKKLTQLDLAEMLGYSDKAISKWENGDTVPDIETLYHLCKFYNVSLDYLVTNQDFNGTTKYIKKMNKKIVINNSLIELLYCSFVWILATIIYTYLLFFSYFNYWQIFIWAITFTFLVTLFFIKVWKNKIYSFIARSLFFWSLIVSFYIQFIQYNVWPLFILIIPIQTALILSIGIKGKLKFKK